MHICISDYRTGDELDPMSPYYEGEWDECDEWIDDEEEPEPEPEPEPDQDVVSYELAIRPAD